MRIAKPLVLTLLVLILVVLHQDWWNWHRKDLVLGFMPIGLAYHAAYSVVCAVMMWLLVRMAWPRHLEDVPATKGDEKAGGH